jgi:hypothetical protein
MFLDISQEINNGNLQLNDERITEGTVETQLLQGTTLTLKTDNGNEVWGLKINYEPILYTYNRIKNHILSIPLAILDTKTVNSTEEIIVIKEYLIKQIELLKNNHRHNALLRYDTIFKETGSNNNTGRTQTKRLRDGIKNLLKEWEEMKYIKTYKEKKQGNKNIGLEIEVKKRGEEKGKNK